MPDRQKLTDPDIAAAKDLAHAAAVNGWTSTTIDGREYVSEEQIIELDERYRVLGEATLAALARVEARLEAAEKALDEGCGPDDPAGCPADNGDQCCGWHEACRRALAGKDA